MADNNQQRVENLGPAERIIQTLLQHTDHLVHNRPGVVYPDGRHNVGVRWEPSTYKVEEGVKVAYKLTKVGKKTEKVRVGVLGDDGKVREGGKIVCDYRQPGLFPETTAWVYQQVTEVWKLDNEFAARWASYSFGQEHRDLKVVLASFMLVQNRQGDPVIENGETLFRDEDFRAVGEAMCLIRRTDNKDLNPKLLLRIGDLLALPGIAAINRRLGFGRSAKNPAMGRWPKAVEKWLRHREANPKMLEGLVKAGFRTTVMELARRVHYVPTSPKFFEILRWKQKQAQDGRRQIAIGVDVTQAETWAGLSETDICKKIMETKPGFKRIVGLLPPEIGMTRAIVAAAVEAGSLSNQDLIILTPTLEDLGLLNVPEVKAKWEGAIKVAENQRAANIAARVKNKDTKEKLQEAAETATKKAVEEVVRGLRVYFMVDISGSMEPAIAKAKEYIAKFLAGFPADKLHIAAFNTSGRELEVKHASKAGVENAFRGIAAGGGTDYGSGVRALQHKKPAADEDVLFIFVGDEEAGVFTPAVTQSGLNPVAFGFLKVRGQPGYNAVTGTAAQLRIPCFMIEEGIFNDPYSIPRMLRNLIAATPVGQAARAVTAAPRLSLVEQILKTDLLQKPAWAP